MLKIAIPGREELVLKNIVFDLNGTLATDGVLNEAARKWIPEIAKDLSVYILTADIFGTAKKECNGLDARIVIVHGGAEKRKFVDTLGPSSTICIGNGFNDIEMFGNCALSVVIIGEEGCSTKALSAADIAVKNSEDAFGLILHPTRIRATLRI